MYLQQVLKQRPGGTQKWPIQNMAYLLIKNNKRIIGKKIMSAGPDLEGSFRCYQYYYYVMYICLNLQLRILALTQFLEFEQSLFCLKICEWAHCIMWSWVHKRQSPLDIEPCGGRYKRCSSWPLICTHHVQIFKNRRGCSGLLILIIQCLK